MTEQLQHFIHAIHDLRWILVALVLVTLGCLYADRSAS